MGAAAVCCASIAFGAVGLEAQPLLLAFRRNCVVDYCQLPNPAALYPYMGESEEYPGDAGSAADATAHTPRRLQDYNHQTVPLAGQRV